MRMVGSAQFQLLQDQGNGKQSILHLGGDNILCA